MSRDAANTAMQSTCTFDGCNKPIRTKSLCVGHYKQKWGGQELRPLRPKLTLEQRFWAKVQKTESCWEWGAALSDHGYGQIRMDGQTRYAHRVAWEITNGPVPEGMDLDHRCGNRLCVRPTHLRVTTRSQNGQHRTVTNKNNASGIRGVYWDKRRGAWRTQVRLNGRRYHGGYHLTIEAADQAAKALRAKLHTHDDHDEWLDKQEEA